MPEGNTLNQSVQPVNLISNPSKFTPFPIFPDRSFRSFENEFFPPMGYVPAFGQRCSSYEEFKKRSSENSFNRSDSFFERPSFFSKVTHWPNAEQLQLILEGELQRRAAGWERWGKVQRLYHFWQCWWGDRSHASWEEGQERGVQPQLHSTKYRGHEAGTVAAQQGQERRAVAARRREGESSGGESRK